MPHFALGHSGGGPLIDIWVGVSEPLQKQLVANNVPVPSAILVKGLVDTGASHTMIDTALPKQFNLTAKNLIPTITPTTGAIPQMIPQFDVSLYVPLGNQVIWSSSAWDVCSADLQHQGFSVLIGRDILANGMLVYDGKHNTFTLAF